MRSKWLMLIPSDAAASRRVSVYRGTVSMGRTDLLAMAPITSPLALELAPGLEHPLGCALVDQIV